MISLWMVFLNIQARSWQDLSDIVIEINVCTFFCCFSQFQNLRADISWIIPFELTAATRRTNRTQFLMYENVRASVLLWGPLWLNIRTDLDVSSSAVSVSSSFIFTMSWVVFDCILTRDDHNMLCGNIIFVIFDFVDTMISYP